MAVCLFGIFGLCLAATAPLRAGFTRLCGPPVREQSNEDQCQPEPADDPGQIRDRDAAGSVLSHRLGRLDLVGLVGIDERVRCPLVFEIELEGIPHTQLVLDERTR